MLLVVFSAIIEFIASELYENGMNNMFLFHIQSTVEFALISLIYFRLFRTPRYKQVVKLFMLLFGLISVYSILFIDGLNEFNTVQRYLEMFFLNFVILLFIRELAVLPKFIPMRQNVYFWLSAGYLIYFSGTILLFVNQTYFLEMGKTEYWIIHGIFNIFLNIVLTFVLWKRRAKLLL